MDIIKNYSDHMDIQDKHKNIVSSGLPRGTRILFIDDNTGKVIREEHNRMVIAGAIYTSCYHFDIEPSINLTNYNTELGIANTANTVIDHKKEYACLFCCGTSGCGVEASQVYPVNYHNRIHPKSLIPFRYEDEDRDLNATQRKIYFGRKSIPDEGKVAYYYKAFDSAPQQIIRFADGTMIDDSIYEIESSQQAVTMVQTRLKITKSDFRDWFFAKEGIENARFNTLSLLTAWKYEDPNTGFTFYNDVRPLTQLNFTNEWLIDLSKSVTIIYQIMY